MPELVSDSAAATRSVTHANVLRHLRQHGRINLLGRYALDRATGGGGGGGDDVDAETAQALAIESALRTADC